VEVVTPRVTLFPNYLHYKLSQASSGMVNQVVRFKIRSSKLKSQVLFSVDQYTQSANFQKLSESNYTLLRRENLLPMTCSTSVQNYKNYGDQKVFISSVQMEQINLVSEYIFHPAFA
jgi:hypothetical protein